MVYESELYHYGVKGMRWGHHKRSNVKPDHIRGLNSLQYLVEDSPSTARGSRSSNLSNRQIRKYAKKGYTDDIYKSDSKPWKVYDKLTGAHKIGGDLAYATASKKERVNRANAYVKSRDQQKAAKAKRKQTIKDKTNEIYKKASLGEKLMYNKKTYEGAAKYVIDNNMSVNDAIKRSKGDALRNTAMYMAACGALTLAQIKMMN